MLKFSKPVALVIWYCFVFWYSDRLLVFLAYIGPPIIGATCTFDAKTGLDFRLSIPVTRCEEGSQKKFENLDFSSALPSLLIDWLTQINSHKATISYLVKHISSLRSAQGQDCVLRTCFAWYPSRNTHGEFHICVFYFSTVIRITFLSIMIVPVFRFFSSQCW